MVWTIAFAVYCAIGLALVFVGPAARRRRRSIGFALFAGAQPRWKALAFSAAIAIGIIALWPILTVSAARIGTRSRLKALDSFDPSPELERGISEVQTGYPDSLLPLAAYQEIEAKLPWTDRWHFRKRLS
jgi:hypothetical protein